MAKEVSIRCGIDSCKDYDKRSLSKCSVYSDRADCSKSMKQRRKSKSHSKRRSTETFCRYY